MKDFEKALSIKDVKLGKELQYKGKPLARFPVVDGDDNVYGVVGRCYEPVSHQSVMAQVREWLPGGKIRDAYSGGGMPYSRMVFNIELPDVFEIDGDSAIKTFVNLRNSLDGTWPIGLIVSPVRVSCRNTFIFHLRDAYIDLRYFHTSKEIARFQSELPIVEKVCKAMEGQVGTATRLSKLPCTTKKGEAFFKKLAAKKLIGKKALVEFTEKIMNPTEADQEAKTYWNLYNVVTDSFSRKLEDKHRAKDVMTIASVGEEFAALVS